ncbi:MAG: hypothetical protein CVV30_02760 [Methanomicrobiales archaeon HGW-Methanomicrobiales-1]|jgi:hypothetical protein|nr:MAG: hypothetical protein CVV30_02760 [Methanomicrobiales archaeon HGW-Methanomicrobiales-1]
MSTYTRLEIGLFLLVIMVVLMPFVLIMGIANASPYHQVSGEPVNEAAQATGITVASVRDSTWNLPGAQGGKTYVLTDNTGETISVSTQSFDNAESRDAAVRLHYAQQVGRSKPVGSLVVIGQHLIYVTPANSNILERLAPILKQKISP